MATLNLTKLWINRLSNGQSVSAYSEPDRSQIFEGDGEVRTYAGGRRRSIMLEGIAGQYTFTMRELSWTNVETLKGWIGVVVQIRDNRGRLMVGVYRNIALTEVRNPASYNATIVLNEITSSVGV